MITNMVEVSEHIFIEQVAICGNISGFRGFEHTILFSLAGYIISMVTMSGFEILVASTSLDLYSSGTNPDIGLIQLFEPQK